MKRGHHWLAQAPDGQFVILYADPVLKNVHRQIETFASPKEATTYAKRNRFELAMAGTMVLGPTIPGDSAKRSMRLKLLQDTIASRLDQLYKAYPDGVGVSDIMKMFDVEYDDARQVLLNLAYDGKGKWIRDPTSQHARKCLYPMDVAEPTDQDLSPNQRAVLEVLTKSADGEGFAEFRLLKLSHDANVPRGSLTFILHELCRKEKIEIASMQETTAGRGGISTTVRVLSKVPSPKPSSRQPATTVFYRKSNRERAT